MKIKTIIILGLLISTILISGCINEDRYDCRISEEPSCRVGCYDPNACSDLIQEYKRQSAIDFSCSDEVDNFIRLNNLTCDMNSMTSNPIGSYHECCRNCIIYNTTGNDKTTTICKINTN